MARGPQRRRLALTVDVEWDPLVGEHGTTGLEEGLPVIVDSLRDRGWPATFFILGEVCDLRPDLLEDVRRPNFEVGSHAYKHTSLHWKSRRWLRRSIHKSDLAINRALDMRPRMFRAPGFSITGKALQVLAETGYEVDSSVLPNAEFRRFRALLLVDSHRDAPAEPYHPSSRNPVARGSLPLVEVPVTENPFQGGTCISSGYLHSRGVKATVQALERARSRDAIFLSHPWEHMAPEEGGSLPRWLWSSCSSDVKIFNSFLDEIDKRWKVVTLRGLAEPTT